MDRRLRSIASAALAALAALAASPAGAQGTVFQSSNSMEQRIRCESNDGREQFCPAQIGGGVRLARTLSRAPCVQGESWRWDSRGVYVRNGCRAEFEFRTSDGWGGGGGWDGGSRYTEIVCASRGSGENFCNAPNDGRVRLVREQGGGSCVEGQSWRAEPQGIRVRYGCVGRFGYFRPSGNDWGGGGGGWGPPPSGPFEVRCESRSHRWAVCPVDIDGPVDLRRQDSHAPCVRGYTWGTISREAIWVSDGCRARFTVNGRPSTRSAAEGSGDAPPGVRRAAPPAGTPGAFVPQAAAREDDDATRDRTGRAAGAQNPQP